jgi:hypothetical protein
MSRCTLLLLALAVGPVRGQTLTDEEKRDGFVSLFDGKTFSGWRFSNKTALPEKLPSNWKVEDGVIKLSGGGSPHLASQWEYEDFDVRFQWRAMRANYNSGFYVRSGRAVGANQINLAKGGEGGLIGNKGAKGAKTMPKLQKPAMEWNDWRVRAVGDRVTFWCNGQLAWEATNFKPARGYLGLQAEGAPMQFRSIRIKEIGYRPLSPTKAWALPEGTTWKVEGDTLRADGKGAPLLTEATGHRSYVLRLEYKGETGTAGAVLLRGDKAPATAVRIGGQPEEAGTLTGHKPKKQAEQLSGAWNYLEVRLTGGKASVWLNGTVVVEGAEVKPDAGPIGLRAAGPMHFRNVRIRDLKE